MKYRKRVLWAAVVVVAIFGFGAVAYAADALPFSDIAGHWAQDSIVNLTDRGIIAGHNDGTFGPDEFVTRAQVATFLDRVEAESMAPVESHRGCPDCHVEPYTLKAEAVSRGGAVHESLADDANINVCLACHAPGEGDREGKGNVAPLSLRDIVHPVHMGSKVFTGHYMGNCFTCHNVDGEGEFQVLAAAVDTDEAGVPDTVPIPGAQDASSTDAAPEVSTSRGGQLYDNWWAVAGLDAPTNDMPVWARQDSNTRSGADTWRCKECHGWDYQGAEGAYGSGSSHFTGFPGVFGAQDESVADLLAKLTGMTDPDHDFSVLSDADLADLVSFLQEGRLDVSPFINAETKAAVGGDGPDGEALYASTCAACHGADGRTLNFGDEAGPEYVGTIASDNPWEFLHKVRNGQPGSSPAMPAVIDLGWSTQDMVDVLTYAQDLPTDAP